MVVVLETWLPAWGAGYTASWPCDPEQAWQLSCASCPCSPLGLMAAVLTRIQWDNTQDAQEGAQPRMDTGEL